jgi:hypothetical protein
MRRPAVRLTPAAALIGAGALLAACGPDAPTDHTPDGGGPPLPDAMIVDDATPPADVAPIPDAGPVPFFGKVYAHSSSQLFEVDPDTLDVTLIGPFTFPDWIFDSITDIALDKDANMIGISYTEVFAIDKDTAVCHHLSTLEGQYNGLSFVPADEIDPTGAEILIGAALSGDISQIDPTTGAATLIGNYGGGWQSSGDIVSVSGFGTVATVNMGEGTIDRLARIDLFAGGVATPIDVSGNGTGYERIFGLGFWRGQVFGFTENQQFLLIDPDTGVGSLVENSIPYWWGAGVTTEAPIIP